MTEHALYPTGKRRLAASFFAGHEEMCIRRRSTVEERTRESASGSVTGSYNLERESFLDIH